MQPLAALLRLVVVAVAISCSAFLITDAANRLAANASRINSRMRAPLSVSHLRHIFGMQSDRQLDAREIESREGEDEQAEDERDSPNRLDRGMRDRLRVKALALDREQQAADQRPDQQRNRDRGERRQCESREPPQR